MIKTLPRLESKQYPYFPLGHSVGAVVACVVELNRGLL